MERGLALCHIACVCLCRLHLHFCTQLGRYELSFTSNLEQVPFHSYHLVDINTKYAYTFYIFIVIVLFSDVHQAKRFQGSSSFVAPGLRLDYLTRFFQVCDWIIRLEFFNVSNRKLIKVLKTNSIRLLSRNLKLPLFSCGAKKGLILHQKHHFIKKFPALQKP